MSLLSGDIVQHNNTAHVVVDVVDECGFTMAVLRMPDDFALMHPVAVLADDLEVIGHLEFLSGWVEDAPGIWRQVGDEVADR